MGGLVERLFTAAHRGPEPWILGADKKTFEEKAVIEGDLPLYR